MSACGVPELRLRSGRNMRSTATRHRGATIALAFVMGTSGCATVIHGTHQHVSIASQDPNAVIKVDGGTVVRPGDSVKLERRDDHEITAEAPGAKPVTTEVKSELSWGYTIVDCLLGLLLFPIGLVFPIVDFADGAIWNLNPTHLWLPAPAPKG